MLRSNDYYPALDADNTDLVTDPIAKVTGNAIVTADGVEREIDVLVVATGFYTTELPITEHVTGRSGQTLAERWRATGMAAYKGTTIPDFPNLFLLVGPNTGQGHTSMIFIIESQIAYVRDAIRTMTERGIVEHRADPRRTPRPGTAACRSGWAAPCGPPAAARAGTSTPTVATPRCGPGPPWTSGADWRRSTPTPTRRLAL